MPGHSSLRGADCVYLSAMPGIHVWLHSGKKDVDGRDKPGHDEEIRSLERARRYRSGIGGRITGPSSDGTVASGSGATCDVTGCDATGCGSGGGGSGGGTT
jgi:hypothetical protein